MFKFEVTVKLAMYANDQGIATTEVEKRLKGGHKAQEDPHAVLIDEITVKRSKTQ